ncbi:MAG: biopolymer transporter ExbD [Spongiibacteraceae bacterium]|jgi:biopolymer transport protein ExbD
MKSSLRAKRMARNHRRMQSTSKLNLVSLMDIFTILVFFLMVNSGDVEVLQSDKDILLPESVAEQRPDQTLLIKISESDVIVQGRAIASVADILASDDNAIKTLDTELKYLAERKPLLTDLEKEKGRAVTIMGDKNIPYKLLKRVMATCAQADYRDISLAVNALPKMDEQRFIDANSAQTSVEGS